MSDRDPLDQLHTLADHAAQHASALPAERIRRLGDQRRHRRYGLSVAAALAVLAIGGGAVLARTGTGRTAPDPVAPSTAVASTVPGPSVSPTPAARTLTEPNLITARDLPKPSGGGQIQPWSRNARPADRISVCQRASLDATTMLTRNFRVSYPGAGQSDGPLADAPSIYTQALQFDDSQAAMRALKTYRDWVIDCGATIKQSSTYEVVSDDDETLWIAVNTSDGTAGGFTQVPLYRDRSDKSENGYFETVGLTVVEDRLMVTVEVLYGNEKHTSYQQGGDSDSGLPEDIQFPLIEAAAKRLAR